MPWVWRSAPSRESSPRKEEGVGRRRDLLRGHENSDGHGQVVGGALLLQLGGGQVDGDAAHGEGTVGVADGCADPVPGLPSPRLRTGLDGGVGQADHVEGRQARGNVHLDSSTMLRAARLRRMPLEAHDGSGEDFGEYSIATS